MTIERVEVDLDRCKCGSDKGVDTPIHGGQSVRRDCAICRTFVVREGGRR